MTKASLVRGRAPTPHEEARLPVIAAPVSIRPLLLALVLFGAVGLLLELLLLEHYESAWQWAPLVLLSATIVTGIPVWLNAGPRTLGAFRLVMLVCLIAGLVGFILHFKGNLEFALERDPDLTGLALIWKALSGATPALAPGAMAQLGLLGLVYTYRHPALARGPYPDPEIV
jgi:hypothetical protein